MPAASPSGRDALIRTPPRRTTRQMMHSHVVCARLASSAGFAKRPDTKAGRTPNTRRGLTRLLVCSSGSLLCLLSMLSPASARPAGPGGGIAQPPDGPPIILCAPGVTGTLTASASTIASGQYSGRCCVVSPHSRQLFRGADRACGRKRCRASHESRSADGQHKRPSPHAWTGGLHPVRGPGWPPVHGRSSHDYSPPAWPRGRDQGQHNRMEAAARLCGGQSQPKRTSHRAPRPSGQHGPQLSIYRLEERCHTDRRLRRPSRRCGHHR